MIAFFHVLLCSFAVLDIYIWNVTLKQLFVSSSRNLVEYSLRFSSPSVNYYQVSVGCPPTFSQGNPMTNMKTILVRTMMSTEKI